MASDQHPCQRCSSEGRTTYVPRARVLCDACYASVQRGHARGRGRPPTNPTTPCPTCGYLMTDLDVECARCVRRAAQPPLPPQPLPPVQTYYQPPAQPLPATVRQVPLNPLIWIGSFACCGIGAAFLAVATYGFGVALLVIGSSIWMMCDASALARGAGQVGYHAPWVWLLLGLLFWILVFPSYLTVRDQYIRSHQL